MREPLLNCFSTRIGGLTLPCPDQFWGYVDPFPGGSLFTRGGMPIAIQFVGRHFEEDLLVRAGHAYQLETDWHNEHPAI